MKIIHNKYIPLKGFAAINLFGVLFIRKGASITNRLLLHESIHTAQMKEMLYIFFYIWYFIEWLFRLIQYMNTIDAYYNISFEREAYENQSDLNYINKRPKYAWKNYFIKNRYGNI